MKHALASRNIDTSSPLNQALFQSAAILIGFRIRGRSEKTFVIARSAQSSKQN